jgi:hypothetical protein
MTPPEPIVDLPRFQALIASTWARVDGGAIAATLGAGAVPDADALGSGFRRFVDELVAALAEMSVAEARSAIERHRDLVRALDRDRVPAAAGTWMYDRDDDTIAVVPLLGEAFHRRVVADPAAAAALERGAGLAEIGGWHPLARPVRARWRAELLAEIPGRFADVPYPGDDAVASGDWPTTEECRYFCGKDWRTLDRAAMYPRHADTSFLAPQGLHYLLPAFLMAALEDVDGSRACGDTIFNQLLFSLGHGYMRACIAMMSVGQREVLGEALRLEYDGWQDGPFAEPDDDLALALAQLDPSTPSPRRPKRAR